VRDQNARLGVEVKVRRGIVVSVLLVAEGASGLASVGRLGELELLRDVLHIQSLPSGGMNLSSLAHKVPTRQVVVIQHDGVGELHYLHVFFKFPVSFKLTHGIHLFLAVLSFETMKSDTFETIALYLTTERLRLDKLFTQSPEIA